MSFDTDINPDYYTNSTLPSSYPSDLDNFLASLYSFLANSYRDVHDEYPEPEHRQQNYC